MKVKYIFYLLILQGLFMLSLTEAQSGKVPPFRMVLQDGKIFRAEDLPLGKPIIIMYFSPECEDCQQLTDKILARITDFNYASIAMITYFPMESVRKFISRNNLAKYSNIFIGTEGDYLFVKNYYNVQQFPFLALYSKDGDLVKKYAGNNINVNDILGHLKNL